MTDWKACVELSPVSPAMICSTRIVSFNRIVLRYLAKEWLIEAQSVLLSRLDTHEKNEIETCMC